MIVGITAVLLGILAVLLITLIINSRKQKEREAERDAAVILLKEQQLIDAIDIISAIMSMQNPCIGLSGQDLVAYLRIVISERDNQLIRYGNIG